MKFRRDDRVTRHLLAGIRSAGDVSHTAAIVAVVAAALVAAIILMTMAPDAGRFAHLRPEQIALYAVEDSVPQRRAYLAFLAILACAALTARWWENLVAPLRAPMAFVIALAVLAPIAATPQAIAALIAGAAIVALLTWSGLLARIAALLLLGFLVAPILFRSAVPEPALLAWIDMHYAAVLSHGQRIASGLKPFTETLPGYGLLPAMAMSMVPQGVSFGAMVRLVQWSQVVFACLLVLAIRIATGPGRPHLFWPASAMTLLALLPFLATNGLAIWFPNQTALRFIMLPVAMVTVLLASRGSAARAALAFGTVGGLGLVHNLETGLVIAAALGVTLVARLAGTTVRTVVLACLQALAAAGLVLGLTAGFVVLRTGAGGDDLLTPLLALFNLFLGGFGGLRLRLTPAFVLILLHAACVVFRDIDSILRRKAPVDGGLLFPATFILLWFPYYVNRAADWNLWTFIAAYGVLLARTAALVPASRLPAVAASAVVVAFSMTNLQALLPTGMMRRGPAPGSTACLDGIHGPAPLCAALRARAEYIHGVAPQGAVWLTHFPLQTMRLSGDAGRLLKIDFINLAISRQEFDSLIVALRRIRPAVILTDAPDPHLPIPDGMMRITDEVMVALADAYCRGEDAAGWRVYRICGPAGG